jgi:hypothetical protein
VIFARQAILFIERTFQTHEAKEKPKGEKQKRMVRNGSTVAPNATLMINTNLLFLMILTNGKIKKYEKNGAVYVGNGTRNKGRRFVVDA